MSKKLGYEAAYLWAEYTDYVMGLPPSIDVNRDSFGNFMEWLYVEYADELLAKGSPDAEVSTPPILPKIDIDKILSTDNGGLALTTEMEQWFYDITKVLNYLVQRIDGNNNLTDYKLGQLKQMIQEQK